VREEEVIIPIDQNELPAVQNQSLPGSQIHGRGDLAIVQAINESSQRLQTGGLPAMTLVHAGSDNAPPHGFWQEVEHAAGTASKVAGEMLQGAVNEVIHEPGTLLKDAAIGAATGAAITFLPALAVPALAFGAYELYKNRPGWL
jgi:hypothetical protein